MSQMTDEYINIIYSYHLYIYIHYILKRGKLHLLRPARLVHFCATTARGALHDDDWQVSPLHVTGSLDNLPPIMVVYGEDQGS